MASSSENVRVVHLSGVGGGGSEEEESQTRRPSISGEEEEKEPTQVAERDGEDGGGGEELPNSARSDDHDHDSRSSSPTYSSATEIESSSSSSDDEREREKEGSSDGASSGSRLDYGGGEGHNSGATDEIVSSLRNINASVDNVATAISGLTMVFQGSLDVMTQIAESLRRSKEATMSDDDGLSATSDA